MNLSIITPTLHDAQHLATMGAISFRESHHSSASLADIDDYISRTYTAENFAVDLANTQNIFRAVRVNEILAGYSKIVPDTMHPLIPHDRTCKMQRLYVLEEFIPLKIGQLLFDEAILTAQSLNQSGIWLNVWTGNTRAIRFYEKQGFEKTGVTEFRISATHSNPNYLMWKEF